ncbi:MAG: DMT family transporter [Deltaproteobacteria bacterium]|nr:DMT family transporter [Deltaproteobacteria bacterium]
MQRTIAIGAGLGSGVLVALMMRLNATLGEHVGVLESSVIVHVVGSLFAMVLLARLPLTTFARRLRATPRRLWIGGALGLVIVAGGNWVIPPLGLALASAIVITATLGCSLVADHCGWFGLARFPMTARRLAGVGCATLGTILIALRLL